MSYEEYRAGQARPTMGQLQLQIGNEEREDCSKFEVSLGYMVSAKLPWVQNQTLSEKSNLKMLPCRGPAGSSLVVPHSHEHSKWFERQAQSQCFTLPNMEAHHYHPFPSGAGHWPTQAGERSIHLLPM